MDRAAWIVALAFWAGVGVMYWSMSGPLDASPASVQACLKMNIDNAYAHGCDQGALGDAVRAAVSRKLGYEVPVCVGVVCN